MINKQVKLAAALAILVLLSACGIPYPVSEPPEYFTMEGRVFVDSDLPARWRINKIIAIKENGDVLGEVEPTLDEGSLLWSLPVVADENSVGTFWVEMDDGLSDIQYYNGGSDERFISGGHYDLNVNRYNINIPIGSYGELKLIGKDAMHPSNENYVLIRDININGDWEPLCKSGSDSFSGIFDGHNHTISGLRLTDKNSWQYAGLFGYVQGSSSEQAELKNLNIEITNTELQLSEINEQCFGVVAGFAENTTFDKITVRGPNTGLKIRKTGGGNFYVGGIVGKIAVNNVTITSGVSKISRSATLFAIDVDADNSGVGYLGGIAGYADSVYGEISISNCYSTGLVALSNITGGDTYAGGILGYHEKHSSNPNNSEITESYTRGEVSVFSNAQKITAAGGIVGGSNGPLSVPPVGLTGARSCALMVSVSADNGSSNQVFAGGFSGYNLAGSEACFQLTSMTITPYSTSSLAVNVTSVDKSALTEKWFAGQSLNWDFSTIWQWDARAGYPKFLWQ
jgi:hypothetical protein